jgi:hypothetical protein
MRRVCLVNGSLRGEKASSLCFLRDVQERLARAGAATQLITVLARPKEGYPRERLKAMAEMDGIVLCFPLYAYTTPGALTRLMEEYCELAADGGGHSSRPRLYAIINSGFPEPVVCEEAIRVMRNFAARARLDYRFSITVTSGAVTALTKKVPFLHPRLKRAYADIVRDINDGSSRATRDVLVRPALPKPLIIWIKDQYEKKMI